LKGLLKPFKQHQKKGDAKMEKLARKLENKAIRNWGFESKKTIVVFRLTALLRK